MKKVFLFFLVITVIACSKKTMPVIERRTEEPPAPKVEISLAYGERIYNNRCARCHDLPKPSKYIFQKWEPILSTMMPRASLSDIESANVKAYVKANAAKE